MQDYQGRNGLRITETRVALYDDPDHPQLKAFASIVLNDAFRIDNIRIVKAGDRILVAMPSRQNKEGVHCDQAHPIDNATRTWMDRHILEAYCDELERGIEDCIADGTAVIRMEDPPSSSCGHPSEDAFFERFDYQAAI